MIRTTKLTITTPGEPIFSERGFSVEIDDEAAGEFIVVRENDAPITGGIRIEPAQWAEIRQAIETMLDDIQEHAPGSTQRESYYETE